MAACQAIWLHVISLSSFVVLTSLLGTSSNFFFWKPNGTLLCTAKCFNTLRDHAHLFFRMAELLTVPSLHSYTQFSVSLLALFLFGRLSKEHHHYPSDICSLGFLKGIDHSRRVSSWSCLYTSYLHTPVILFFIPHSFWSILTYCPPIL